MCLIKLNLHSDKVSSSPSLPLLFAIVFWGETNRSALSQLFLKIDVLNNFVNFTGKHQCWSLFLIKLQAWMRLQHRSFPVKFVKFWIPFYRTYPVVASEQTQEISVVHCVTKGFFWWFSTSLPWLSNIMLNLLSKSSFDIFIVVQAKLRSHFNFKLYCGLWISHIITTHFVYINTQKLLV